LITIQFLMTVLVARSNPISLNVKFDELMVRPINRIK
jgi:hypothetical protein